MQRLKVPSLLQSDDTLRMESPSENGQKAWEAVTEAYATERVGFLLGQYAKARPHEPAIYTAALAAILSEYPKKVVDYVTDPRTGLASTLKWIPEPAEVREACEAQAAPQRRKYEREFLERKNKEALEPPVDRSGRKSYEEIQAEFAAVGIYIGSARPATATESAASFKAKTGISDAEYDAIPDLPPRSKSPKK
jgi:hypothetical protein